jgi:Glycosyltransferase family 87
LRRPPAAVGALTVIVAGVVVVGVGIWLAATSLQQDFAAYWIAGRACRLGLDPYLNQVGSTAAPALWDGLAIFRHSRFLYSPLVAELFRPLAALPYRGAKLLFTAAMLAAWGAAGLLLGGDRRSRLWFFGSSALFFPLYRHLERGQIDLLILLLLVLAWRAEAARPLVAGAALALGTLFKPALLMLLPVVWAGGRARVVAGALGAGLALIGLTVVLAGPTRLHEYLSSVLPRAALYGEGGTRQMLLPAERFPDAAAHGPDREIGDDTTWLDGRDYRTSRWEAPASASLPRLLAPDSPSRASSLLPAALALLGLVWAARRLRVPAAQSSERPMASDDLLLFATAVAGVVASPTGWVMGLVVALPLAPRAAGLWTEGRLSRPAALTLAAAFVAVAVPAPFSGFPALAGAALVAAAAAAALARPARRVTA